MNAKTGGSKPTLNVIERGDATCWRPTARVVPKLKKVWSDISLLRSAFASKRSAARLIHGPGAFDLLKQLAEPALNPLNASDRRNQVIGVDTII